MRDFIHQKKGSKLLSDVNLLAMLFELSESQILILNDKYMWKWKWDLKTIKKLWINSQLTRKLLKSYELTANWQCGHGAEAA